MLLAFAPLVSADVGQKVHEGVTLYDAGRIDEAIAKYKEALAEDPKNVIASFELALAYGSKKDYAGCRMALEPVVGIAGQHQLMALTLLGNCLDASGERNQALDAYRRALALAPNDPSVNYELGLALLGAGKFAEAREALKIDTTARPGHTNGHYALAYAFKGEGFRAAALMEALRALALEPATQRSADLMKQVRAMLHAGVEQKDPRNITLTIDPDERKEEGDYSGLTMGMAIVAGAGFADDVVKKNAFERAQGEVANIINIFVESTPLSQKDYTAQMHVPFFSAMSKAKLIDTFAGIALSTQKLDGGEEWMRKNKADIDRYNKWISEYRNPRAMVEMPVPTP